MVADWDSQTCLSQRSSPIALTDRYYTLLNMDYELCPPRQRCPLLIQKIITPHQGIVLVRLWKNPPSFESFDWWVRQRRCLGHQLALEVLEINFWILVAAVQIWLKGHFLLEGRKSECFWNDADKDMWLYRCSWKHNIANIF